jgi:hypothetical protein
MNGVSWSRICTSVLWTLFFSLLLVRGDDILEQGMCLIKLKKLFGIFCPLRLLCIYCFDFRITVGILRRSCEILRCQDCECS